MCFPSAPSPQPARQAAKAPDMGAAAGINADMARKRMGYAASILTPTGGLGAASTTSKTLLGA